MMTYYTDCVGGSAFFDWYRARWKAFWVSNGRGFPVFSRPSALLQGHEGTDGVTARGLVNGRGPP